MRTIVHLLSQGKVFSAGVSGAFVVNFTWSAVSTTLERFVLSTAIFEPRSLKVRRTGVRLETRLYLTSSFHCACTLKKRVQ